MTARQHIGGVAVAGLVGTLFLLLTASIWMAAASVALTLLALWGLRPPGPIHVGTVRGGPDLAALKRVDAEIAAAMPPRRRVTLPELPLSQSPGLPAADAKRAARRGPTPAPRAAGRARSQPQEAS